jgi:hypothetical protein
MMDEILTSLITAEKPLIALAGAVIQMLIGYAYKIYKAKQQGVVESTIKANTPREAIEKYFERDLYYKFNIDFATIEIDEILHYSVLVDHENTEANEKQIESWKVKDVPIFQGGAIMNVLSEIGKSKKIKYYCPYHEQALAMAVDAYSRLT